VNGRRRCSSRGLGTAVLKFVFAVSVAGLAFTDTYSSAPHEFSAVELRDLLLLGAAAHALLLGAALAFLRFRAQNAVLASIVALSAASANLIHTDLYLIGHRAVFWGSVMAIWAGLFAVLEFMDSNRWLRGGVSVLALAALAISAAPHLGILSLDADPAESARDYQHLLNPIAFESMPNLYFVSFDGLAPQSLGQEYLDIETTAPIELVDAEFRRLPNLFAESRWSLHSLNAVVHLERGITKRARERLGPLGHLTGEFPTPLFDLLRDNGYELTFVYPLDNFGRPGPYVDNVSIGSDRSLCRSLDPSISSLAFWGYCNLAAVDPADWYQSQHDEQLESVLLAADRHGPQFVFSYFKLPEHTAPGFDYSDSQQRADYASRYVQRSNRAAVLIARLLDTLRTKDPEAMLFVFGDHGPRLTYNMDFEDDSDLYVKDSLGVLGGIWPPDACEPWFDETLAEPYLTILDAVHTILRCLSGGSEALAEPLADPAGRVMRDYHGIPNDDPERTLADYLYD